MNQVTTAPLPGTRIDPRYPDSDGRFMGETDFHNLAMIWLREGLEDHFTDQAVYVASNLVFYFQESAPLSRRDPDVLVARGVGKHRRRSYRIWEEQVIPCSLFEIASRRTWRVDAGKKRLLYASLDVKEYFVFDPEARYLKPALQGFRTRQRRSVALKPAADGSLVSKELGLRLVPEGTMLRLIDIATGQPVLTRAERAEQERERADQATQRVQELQAENERLRGLLKKKGRTS
jgi:Uma2 family endonuclease